MISEILGADVVPIIKKMKINNKASAEVVGLQWACDSNKNTLVNKYLAKIFPLLNL